MWERRPIGIVALYVCDTISDITDEVNNDGSWVKPGSVDFILYSVSVYYVYAYTHVERIGDTYVLVRRRVLVVSCVCVCVCVCVCLCVHKGCQSEEQQNSYCLHSCYV